MGAFDNIIYGKVIKIERDGQWSPDGETMYIFRVEIETAKKGVLTGKFYKRYIKEVKDLGFTTGQYFMCEYYPDKDQLKPVV